MTQNFYEICLLGCRFELVRNSQGNTFPNFLTTFSDFGHPDWADRSIIETPEQVLEINSSLPMPIVFDIRDIGLTSLDETSDEDKVKLLDELEARIRSGRLEIHPMQPQFVKITLDRYRRIGWLWPQVYGIHFVSSEQPHVVEKMTPEECWNFVFDCEKPELLASQSFELQGVNTLREPDNSRFRPDEFIYYFVDN